MMTITVQYGYIFVAVSVGRSVDHVYNRITPFLAMNIQNM